VERTAENHELRVSNETERGGGPLRRGKKREAPFESGGGPKKMKGQRPPRGLGDGGSIKGVISNITLDSP